MTDDEQLNVKCAIAMGWKCWECEMGGTDNWTPPNRHHMLYAVGINSIPKYATDSNAALLLVETMREAGYYVSTDARPNHHWESAWKCVATDNAKTIKATADTRNLAEVKCFLAWHEQEKTT